MGEQLHELRTGDPDKVLAAMRALERVVGERVQEGRREEVLKVVTGSLEYLHKRREQIRYAEFLAAGYPIGSGAVESANKLVVEARLKGSGMHWADEQVDPMLALRNVVCSDRWEEAWTQISQQLRKQARDRKAALQAARREHRVGAAEQTPQHAVPTEPLEGAPRAVSDAKAQAPSQTIKKLTTTGTTGTTGATGTTGPASATGPRRPDKDHPWRHMPVGRPR